jgi:large subunit ribosomal protein L10
VTRSSRCCPGRPRSRSSAATSSQAAKGLLDFAKANPLLVIKGGVLDGKALTAAEIGKLADLEPREVLLAKLAGAMKASMAGAAATFNALPTQMALAEAAVARGAPAAPRSRPSTPQADEAPARTDTAAPADATEAPEVADAAGRTETQD